MNTSISDMSCDVFTPNTTHIKINTHIMCTIHHTHHNSSEKNKVPETKTKEGTASRNIARKHDHDPNK